MNVRVEPNRFLSVACDPDERIVFDRKETTYHLLRDSAARLWDEICEGGTFQVAPVATEGEDPVAMLAEAGLLGLEEADPSEGITRRVWLRRTGKASAAAVVLPLVATITTPALSLAQGDVSIDDTAPLNEVPDQIDQTLTRRELRREERRLRRLERRGGEETEETGTRIRARDRKNNKKNEEESTSTEASTGTRTRTRTRSNGNEGSSSSLEDFMSRLGR